MRILTHRGLDPSKNRYLTESTIEAFSDQLSRGYGLEFDLQMTADDFIVVMHDSSLKRISGGKDMRSVSEITAAEILNMEFDEGHIPAFPDLLNLIDKKQADESVSAIHVKHDMQERQKLDIIIKYLETADTDKFILFDLKIEAAGYLRKMNHALKLAPSVSHPYDIKRYNSATGGTLMSVDEVLRNRSLFDWVWLDEWDLSDENGAAKKLYTEKTFSKIREAGLKVALVTPELHGTSPGLLGNESHPDSKSSERLIKRLREIINLKPDVICTDYPDMVRELAQLHKK